MFTGIVARVSPILAIKPGKSGGKRLEVGHEALAAASGRLHPWADLELGESIAVNGACLTLVDFDAKKLAFDVIEESLRRSSLGTLQVGHAVNLERALRVGDRLGGHYVTGHIDALGQIKKIQTDKQETIIRIQVDPIAGEQEFKTIEKGSVTIDGISLTVVDSQNHMFSVALIPHTLEVTTLGQRQEGDRVNLEMDHFGKWVQTLLGKSSPATPPRGGSSAAQLF